MNEEQIQWLKENLTLDISEDSRYTYCGGGDGSMYTTYKEVKLVIAGEVISTASFT